MRDEETERLIATAKGDVEACEQLLYWTDRLRRAIDARRRLLEAPPERVIAALEARR